MTIERSSLVSNDTDKSQTAMDTENPFVNDPAPAAENAASNVISWHLLLRIATGDETTVNVVTLHKEIFALLLARDDKFAIIAKDGSTVTDATDFPTEKYKSSFDMRANKTHFTVAHAVYSTMTLSQLKRQNKPLLELLNANNAYLDLSATGSLMEIVLGPILGIHPDNTNKNHILKDLIKLAMTCTKWADGTEELRMKAKEKLAFISYLPAFQLQTRRIRRKINDVEYSVKAVCFICAAEHRELWEQILVNGAIDGWLMTLGRFYLLQRNDTSDALRSAMCWHNKTVSLLKAVVITGITSLEMDSGVKQPHHVDQRPSLRDKLCSGGFVTIVRTQEEGKWIGVSTNAEDAKLFINTIMRDLCRAAYSGGRPIPKPTAKDSVRPVKTNVPPTDARSLLFDKQSKTWADIANDTIDDNTTHTETNIARRPPRFVKFKSNIRFDDNDEGTKLSTPDSATAVTAVTQNDLKSFADSLRTEIREEFKSTYSDLSSHTGVQSTQQSILATLHELSKERQHSLKEREEERTAARLAKEEERKAHLLEREEQKERMRSHTEHMAYSMRAMAQMMQTMKDMVAANARNDDSNSDLSSVATYTPKNCGRTESPLREKPMQELPRNNDDMDDDSVRSGDDSLGTGDDYFSTDEKEAHDDGLATQENPPSEETELRRSKRKQATSPDLKRNQKNSGRNSSRTGRGPASGRARKSGVRTNLSTNQYAPLGESEVTLPAGGTN